MQQILNEFFEISGTKSKFDMVSRTAFFDAFYLEYITNFKNTVQVALHSGVKKLLRPKKKKKKRYKYSYTKKNEEKKEEYQMGKSEDKIYKNKKKSET